MTKANEPVAWMNKDGWLTHYKQGDATIPLYAHPQSADVEPVGEVYRYGKDSRGRQWHGIHWYDSSVDVPTKTKLYVAPPDLAAKVAELEAQNESQRLALENIRLFAARHRKEDWALLVLRFCADGGVVGSITR